jgi:hypothetical protein
MTPEEKLLRNRAYQKAYYERHREKVMARTAAWNAANPWCAKKSRKTYYDKNPKARSELSKHYVRLSRGIPEPTRPIPDRCENCGGVQKGKRLSIDHCHETGAFRGWLCDSCNLGLGKLGDTIEAVERALEYLKRAQCQMKLSELPSPSQGLEPQSNSETSRPA